MKIAVIGCGGITNAAHIPAYMNNPEAEIACFCDIIPERAEAAVKQYGCGKAITDYKEVLADPEVQAISVCTPNKMHPIIAMDAMRAGKLGEIYHVYISFRSHRCIPGSVRTEGSTITFMVPGLRTSARTKCTSTSWALRQASASTMGQGFDVYTTENDALISYAPSFNMRNHFQNEIDAFIDCVKTGKRMPSHIDTAIITAQMMQALYDSAAIHREVVIE